MIMLQYLIKKISLATVDSAGVNHTHRNHIVYMLKEIQTLTQAGRAINLRELAVHLHRVSLTLKVI